MNSDRNIPVMVALPIWLIFITLLIRVCIWVWR